MTYTSLKEQFLTSSTYSDLYKMITSFSSEEIFQEDNITGDVEDRWNHVVLGTVFEYVYNTDPSLVGEVYQLCEDTIETI